MRKRLLLITLLGMVFLALSACSIAPVRSYAPTEEVPAFALPTPVPTRTPTPRPSPTPLPASASCSNNLQFLRDVGVFTEDDVEVAPGALIDKRWLVKNSGSCNWGPGYTMDLRAPSQVNVNAPMDLYPAIAQSEVVLRAQFFAPEEPGTYTVDFIARAPNSTAFGHNFYFRFIVKAPSE
jgi:hypothetical protein